MKKIERPYNSDEIKILKSWKYTTWQHFENFGLKWIFATGILIGPFLLYEKFIEKVPPETELPIAIFLQVVSLIIVLYFMNKMGELNWNKEIENEIKNGKAQVLKITTDKVLKRTDPEDYGSGFYLKIDENKTLFLQGQYFDELQYSRKFPNTDFEIVRTLLNVNRLIEINSIGKYLKPDRKLKAFTNEQYTNDDFHYDGDILDIPIDAIK